MKILTLIFIPTDNKKTVLVKFPQIIVSVVAALFVVLAIVCGYLVMDYNRLRSMAQEIDFLRYKNEKYRSEAELLVANLDHLKKTLRSVKQYSDRIENLVGIKVQKVHKKIGMTPQTLGEHSDSQIANSATGSESMVLPAGIDPDLLEFRPVLEGIFSLSQQATEQALNLRVILSDLSKRRSLLASMPTLKPAAGWFASPFGHRISPFTGKRTFHRGLDIAAPIGTPILAPADGVAIYSGRKSGFGNFIMIAHYENGIVTKYGHNSENMVYVGQKIRKGDQIASVGVTGRTTGPHLHYEVWSNGRPVNPKRFILDQSVEGL